MTKDDITVTGLGTSQISLNLTDPTTKYTQTMTMFVSSYALSNWSKERIEEDIDFNKESMLRAYYQTLKISVEEWIDD